MREPWRNDGSSMAEPCSDQQYSTIQNSLFRKHLFNLLTVKRCVNNFPKIPELIFFPLQPEKSWREIMSFDINILKENLDHRSKKLRQKRTMQSSPHIFVFFNKKKET